MTDNGGATHQPATDAERHAWQAAGGTIETQHHPNGQTALETWIAPNGRVGRPDGPAVRAWADNGQIIRAMYMRDGLLDRPDGGPALEAWYPTGTRQAEEWWTGGDLGRPDGPAVRLWHPNGQPDFEEWWNGGRLSRPGGEPAITHWDIHGRVIRQEVWIENADADLDGPYPPMMTEISYELTPVELHLDAGGEIKHTYWPDGKIHSETWLDADGNQDRVDGPAYQRWHQNGQLAEQKWSRSDLGGAFRDGDLPAQVTWWPNGQIATETWLAHDMIHRPGGPAVRSWDPHGNLVSEAWLQRDEYLRGDGPAYISYWPDGTSRRQEWMTMSLTHRPDGPAVTEWDAHGQVVRQEWWIEGSQIATPPGGAAPVNNAVVTATGTVAAGHQLTDQIEQGRTMQ